MGQAVALVGGLGEYCDGRAVLDCGFRLVSPSPVTLGGVHGPRAEGGALLRRSLGCRRQVCTSSHGPLPPACTRTIGSELRAAGSGSVFELNRSCPRWEGNPCAAHVTECSGVSALQQCSTPSCCGPRQRRDGEREPHPARPEPPEPPGPRRGAPAGTVQQCSAHCQIG